MKRYISVNDVEKGVSVNNIMFPPIKSEAQAQLRFKKKIKSTKIAGKIHYLEEWLQDYIDSYTIDVVALNGK